MKRPRSAAPVTQADVDILTEEFKDFIGDLRRKWLQENNDRSQGIGRLYEIDPEEQRRVKRVTARWAEHITPIAEEWWRQRGFGVIWSKDPSDEKCQVYLLDTEAA